MFFQEEIWSLWVDQENLRRIFPHKSYKKAYLMTCSYFTLYFQLLVNELQNDLLKQNWGTL